MAEIHVFFPPTGAPTVRNDPEAVVPGDHIEWRFHSLRPGIKKVRIQFADPAALFFPTPSGPLNGIEKDLGKGRFIWGTAPAVPSDSARGDKYSILALDGSGNTITEASIDPTIITEHPRP
jgi:hypothetical protein